jgi:hypothetical protein
MLSARLVGMSQGLERSDFVRWGRPDDTIGFAGVVNAISNARIAFLNAEGLGVLVDNGQLPNWGTERATASALLIVEITQKDALHTSDRRLTGAQLWVNQKEKAPTSM